MANEETLKVIDYIDRFEVLELLKRYADLFAEPPMDDIDHKQLKLVHEIEFEIKKLPTLDCKEVVRCKDCKYRHKTAFRSYCMPVFGLKQITDLNAFCSYGQRK